jgi:hypothetical protein
MKSTEQVLIPLLRAGLIDLLMLHSQEGTCVSSTSDTEWASGSWCFQNASLSIPTLEKHPCTPKDAPVGELFHIMTVST